MVRLKLIQPWVQDTAEAIAFALNCAVEIRDRDGIILGKSGCQEDPLSLTGSRLKVIKRHSTILADEKAIGEISIQFHEEKEKKDLAAIDKYLNHMALLLSGKAAEAHALKQVKELTTILETVHEGSLVIDSNGVVTYCNLTARKLLKLDKEGIIGRFIGEILPGTPALEALKTGREYTEKEEIYQQGHRWMHFIVTVRLIKGIKGEIGAVLSFRDIGEARRLIYDLSEHRIQYTFDDIIGCSDVIKQLKEQALRVAAGNSTVLITGDTGTGKEVFSQAIHFASPRSRGPFISVNCGAIPDNLLESELFGYERGAFTGALKEGKAGKFELADGGTIFLDEIGEMPFNLQVKLLHVLQNREVERVGGNKKIPVDIRIIAASNRDLEKMMEERKFRRDLFFRLGVIPLHIPPLRERREDIPLLAHHCLKKYGKKLNRPNLTLSPGVIEYFIHYPWPGNVREMENAVEYAINVCTGSVITVENLPPRIRNKGEEPFTTSSTLESLIKNYEKKVLEQYLKRFGTSPQSKDEIARMLGISRATLYRKLSRTNVKNSSN
jgi:PAS domain S-box-containing protein